MNELNRQDNHGSNKKINHNLVHNKAIVSGVDGQIQKRLANKTMRGDFEIKNDITTPVAVEDQEKKVKDESGGGVGGDTEADTEERHDEREIVKMKEDTKWLGR